MGIVIPRTEVHEIEKKGWVLLYGRRKVGKTFLIRNFVKHTHYFFVERAGPILMANDLVRPSDILKVFRSVDELVFLRDPWLIQFYDGSVRDAVKSGFASVRGLIGEIFIEEDRELTETYEGILRALAVGNVFPKDVARFLGKTSSDIKSFLANLLEMGLVKRIKVFGKKRWIYRISSPVVDLFYYLDTKYGVSELSVDNRTFESAYREKLPRYFEDFVRAALAEKFGGEEEVMLSPEVDAVITVRGKVVCCAEVKMKARKKDLEVLRSKTSGLDCEKIVVDADNVMSLFG